MIEGITRTYTIAFAMRSGSNEICSLLRRNGLGIPTELFQFPLPPDTGSQKLESFISVAKNNQANGIFGSKVSHNHRAALDEYFKSSVPGYRQLDDILPHHRWVWLTRKDKMRQAISLCRAEQSNTWAVKANTDTKRLEFKYDFFELHSRLMTLLVSDFMWQLYFQRHGIQPLSIVYEDFFADLERQLRRLVDYLGGPGDGRTGLEISPDYAIQRPDTDSAVCERFADDLCRLGEVGFAQELGLPLQLWTQFFFGYGWRKSTLD